MERLSSFNSQIEKKNIIKMSKYFLKPKSFGGKVKVELDLSNYVTKEDLMVLVHRILLKRLIYLIKQVLIN